MPTVDLAPTELGYTGHRSLTASADFGIGLIDMGGRVYEPNAGQFVQPDPTFPNLGHPQGFNRRSYVRNDPINLIDPTGFCDERPDGTADCRTPTGGTASGGGEGGKARREIKHRWKKFKAKRERKDYREREKEGRKSARTAPT